MSRTFICSTGTSAAKLLADDAGKRLPQGMLRAWVQEQDGDGLGVDGRSRAAARILATFQDYEPAGEALTDKLSAEIHSLARIPVKADDRVLLLSSDTPEGLACATAVAGFLEHHWIGLQVVTEVVTGLQVDDAERFRRVGVVEFTRRCLREIRDYHTPISGQPANVILNPTGGYKALVPYAVLIGMLKNIPCRYIFEQSATLLELPPLPVEFRRSTFEAYKPLLEQLERDELLPLDQWQQHVPFEDRSLLEPLIDLLDDHVALSAIGLLFLDEVRTSTRLVPFLSRQAWADCWDNLRSLDDCEPFRFLTRMSSPQALEEKTHINGGNGLRWLKPGRTTDRYLVSVEGWRLLVWRAIREDQVGPDYPRQTKVHPDRDRTRYAPFTRLEFAP